jgi:hypothetical protein
MLLYRHREFSKLCLDLPDSWVRDRVGNVEREQEIRGTDTPDFLRAAKKQYNELVERYSKQYSSQLLEEKELILRILFRGIPLIICPFLEVRFALAGKAPFCRSALGKYGV